MGTDGASRTGGGAGSRELMLALLDRAMNLIRAALREGRRCPAVELYRGNENDTKATAAALLSAWETFARDLDDGDLAESLGLPELAALFIRRAHNRMRRRDYRDRQVADQVIRAHPYGPDGEPLPFDPADPHQREEVLKNLPVEIAEVVQTRSERDRLVIDLWLGEHTYEDIVERVRGVLPGEPISLATVQRIVERFRDDMRGRLE